MVQKKSKSEKLYRIMKQVKQAFEEIAASIHSATISEFPEIVGELERLRTLIQVRMLNVSPALSPIPQSVSPDGGQYLSVEQVAQRFHVTPKWLYRHKKQLPHSQPSRKLLLFPERAITNWFANRRRS